MYKPNNREYLERYLVAILEVNTGKIFYTLIPDRVSFSVMLGLMPSNKYAVLKMDIIAEIRDFETFLLEIRNKPEDLQLG